MITMEISFFFPERIMTCNFDGEIIGYNIMWACIRQFG